MQYNYILSGSGEVQYDKIKNLKPETRPYYQTLIDKRDIPYVVSEVEIGSVHLSKRLISPPC